MGVERRQSQNQQKGRKDKGRAGERRPQASALDPPQVHGELSGQWSGRQLRKCQALHIVLF